MQSYLVTKEQVVTDTPLVLFDCTLPDGTAEHWSTHSVTVSGVTYASRVLRHNLFELQAGADQGVDAFPRISFDLANADSHFSEIERSTGWKGAKISARFLFYDLRGRQGSPDAQVLFSGIVGPPEMVTENTFRLSAINRLSMQRVVLPPVRVQRRCPWTFPATAGERQEALDGGADSTYSRFYRCGYSADQPGGYGNLSDGAPYTSCSYTRADCQARGMFRADSRGQATARFGGIEYVPATITVRSAGEKGSHLSPVGDNEARYNDFVPLIYGTAWTSPDIVFARNDGNLTRMEVLLGVGPITGVTQVVVNNIQLPHGVAGMNMTGTGWFNPITLGSRQGAFNPDFTDGHGNPLGDPYGSMAFLSVVVPNRINDGSSLPSIRVLVQGLALPGFATDGSELPASFTNNPAWVVLDILRRAGWSLQEFDLPSFAAAAAFCEANITSQDLYGQPLQTPRFQCNLVIQSKRSAGDVLRGIRNSSRLYLTYASSGLLQLRVENAIGLQQSARPAGSNSNSPVNSGWPAYEFGDGTGGGGGILRNADGSSSVRLWSKAAQDSPNRFSVEFQDALNEYQQDSYSLVDPEDVALTGQEVSAGLNVLGIPHYDQAARVAQFFLNKSVNGNTWIEFQTSVRGVTLMPGDLIAVTYAKEGFTRQLFRIQKIAPALNYRTLTITAQIHDDAWYSDSAGQTAAAAGSRREAAFQLTTPRPIAGTVLGASNTLDYGVTESFSQTADGTAQLVASVAFAAPEKPSAGAPAIPLVSLAAQVSTAGGTLAANQNYYYAVSAVDASEVESPLSFVVFAQTASSATSSITLSGLSFPSAALSFHVYRGNNPQEIRRIASNVAPTPTFVDAGLSPTGLLPPDRNFDHVNFYWRMEVQPESAATIFSSNTIGNAALNMGAGAFQGRMVRITRGTGAGEELPVMDNTASTLSLSGTWTVLPDSTSYFVVCETAWEKGATGKVSPVRFAIPNRAGATVQLMGRSANANDVECPLELSPVTRWQIGGGGIRVVDSDVPALPVFGLAPSPLSGTVELSGVAFSDITNITSISAGTLSLHYIDEIAGTTTLSLLAAAGTAEVTIFVGGVTGAPQYLQIDQEVLAVTGIAGSSITVKRAQFGSSASSHAAGALVWALSTLPVVTPFVRGFFGSPASGSWVYPISLPNVRIAAAEFSVTNSQGTSPVASQAYTSFVDGGIRTLSGGQFSLQLSGYAAVETGAVPEVSVDAPRAIRDISAVVASAPLGANLTMNLNVNGSLLCALVIRDGNLATSGAVDGVSLPPLRPGDKLSLDITGVGLTAPGSDLTVTIRV